MRVILIIAFFLQVSLAIAQETKKLTLEKALSAILSNPKANTDSTRKIIASEVKSAWYLYLYQINRHIVLEEYLYSFDDLVRITELRYQAGEIDFFEYTALNCKIADIQVLIAISDNEIEMAQNSLQQLLFTDNKISPADSSLSIYEIDKSFRFTDFGTVRIFTPEDSSLSCYHEFIHNKTVEYKQLELDNLFIRLHFYNFYRLPYAETIIHTAQARYKSEEIDYTDFTSMVSDAFKIKLDYLEILNNYNQYAIKLEIYAY